MLGNIEGRRRRGCRGWDGLMVSLTWWMWVWAGSRSWWWTGKPGVLQSMASHRVGHDWATELNWTELWKKKWKKKGAWWLSGKELLPAMQETWVWSLNQEDPLEKEMATHSSILAWEIPQTEEPSRLHSMGYQKSWMQLNSSTTTIPPKKTQQMLIRTWRNWNPLHYQ